MRFHIHVFKLHYIEILHKTDIALFARNNSTQSKNYITLKNAFIVTTVVHKTASHHSRIQYQYEADDSNYTVYNRTLWSLVRIKGVLGVKVYGSQHPMSKRTWDNGVAKIQKGRKTSGVHHPWGQGDGGGQALGT